MTHLRRLRLGFVAALAIATLGNARPVNAACNRLITAGFG